MDTEDAAAHERLQPQRDDAADTLALVCQVGSSTLDYHARAIDDLHAMLFAAGDWVLIGSADDQKEPAPATVEA